MYTADKEHQNNCDVVMATNEEFHKHLTYAHHLTHPSLDHRSVI